MRFWKNTGIACVLMLGTLGFGCLSCHALATTKAATTKAATTTASTTPGTTTTAHPAGKAATTSSATTTPATPTSIGTFDTWTAYTMPDGGKLMCYALSKPSAIPDKSKRAKVYLMVTHRPAEKTLNVVSISLGYATATNGSAAVTTGKTKFDFFTRDQTAWSRDSDTDKAVVTSMRKAQNLSIKAKPAKSGAETTDSYSLIGFPAALDAIDKACKVKR